MNATFTYKTDSSILQNAEDQPFLCSHIKLPGNELVNSNQVVKELSPLQKGEHLYRLHDEFSLIYIVRSGCLKTVIITESGEEKITGFYLAGDIVGAGGISDQYYHNSAIAVETSSVCGIRFNQTEFLYIQFPHLHTQILKAISRKIVTDQQSMLILNHNRAEVRIASYLVHLSQHFKNQCFSALQWRLPMSKSELGNYLGLTIESVSRTMSKLKKQDVIDVDKRHVTIKNIEQLQSIANIKIR